MIVRGAPLGTERVLVKIKLVESPCCLQFHVQEHPKFCKHVLVNKTEGKVGLTNMCSDRQQQLYIGIGGFLAGNLEWLR